MWRLVPPKLGRLSRSLKLAALGSLLVLMVLHSPSLLASWQRNELADRRFLQLNKCPACFGTSWCRRFLNGQVVFEAWGRLRLLDFLNVKNVYFAQYGEPREGGRRRVVLKRLGSQRELAQLDQSICKRATGRPRCDLLQAMPRTEFARLNGDVRLLTPEAVEGWSDLVHCPSQRLLDRLVRRYAETKDSGSFLLRNLKDSERMQLLLTLAFNPEPLVLQVGAGFRLGASCREGRPGNWSREKRPRPRRSPCLDPARRGGWRGKAAAQGDPGRSEGLRRASRLRTPPLHSSFIPVPLNTKFAPAPALHFSSASSTSASDIPLSLNVNANGKESNREKMILKFSSESELDKQFIIRPSENKEQHQA
ncbi:hypothetical protein Celaphus_00013012 [Cervus elaphus hippelaphus]|uniref:Uncharacterized protein n=1 Tax=Cervus elaphus hippelaphus TaxID=46360 RepID=A0A212CIM1_CEREH|nr:hypothetical protein Celaphus_00013012 [Cervus elaphus hippelaphus]